VRMGERGGERGEAAKEREIGRGGERKRGGERGGRER